MQNTEVDHSFEWKNPEACWQTLVSPQLRLTPISTTFINNVPNTKEGKQKLTQIGSMDSWNILHEKQRSQILQGSYLIKLKYSLCFVYISCHRNPAINLGTI